MATEYLNNRVFENVIATFQKSRKDIAKYELIVEDMCESVERAKVIKTNPKSDMLFEMLETSETAFKTASDNYTDSQNQLANLFNILAVNIVNYARFQNIDPDDAVQEGVLICFEKIDRFDPRKGKAFNYMTTCVLNHFRQLYRSQRNYQELKKKYLNHIQMKINMHLIKSGKDVCVPMTGIRDWNRN